jgi:glycosyltransferase involved in cell wall biosynthesis
MHELVFSAVDATSPSWSAQATTEVLHVINGEHYSGAERVQDLLAQELPALGFKVGFACVKPGRFPEARKSKLAKLYECPMQGPFDFACVHRLVELIRTHHYALVHAHTPRSVLVGSLAARRAGVPLVYHVHSPTARDSTRRFQNWINARLERWSLRHAARLIAVSPSLRQLMCDAGFAGERVEYVPNGVPLAEASSPRSWPVGVWTLGMAALFRPRKGVEILLAALAELRGRGHHLRLRAVGPFESPEYESEIKQLADRLGVADAITWTGFVSDIGAELARIDLFVLPSLFGEGLPMVVLESMAAGVPVVASRVEGVPEAIRHGQDGLLCEPANASQLAEAVEQIITHQHDYATMSLNAQRRHAERFSARAMATGVARVYREILELHGNSF